MRVRPSVTGTFAALGAVIVLASAPCARAAEDDEPGRRAYRRYCGACHGPAAHGDGVASSLMRPTPPDLTQLASRHGGQFPMDLVVKTIDGREMPRAHGDPAMPVWGDILGAELGGGAQSAGVERRVSERIYSIAEFLRSIQTH